MAFKPGWKRRALLAALLVGICLLTMQPELMHLSVLADSVVLDALLTVFEVQLLLAGALLWRHALVPLLKPVWRGMVGPLLGELHDLGEVWPDLGRWMRCLGYSPLLTPVARFAHVQLSTTLSAASDSR